MECEKLRGLIVNATASVARGTATKITNLTNLRTSNNQSSASDTASRSPVDYRYHAQLTKNMPAGQQHTVQPKYNQKVRIQRCRAKLPPRVSDLQLPNLFQPQKVNSKNRTLDEQLA